MEQGMIADFFGGVSQDGSSWWGIDYDKVLLELARWLVPIGVCLLAEGVCLERWRKIERLSCYRYETVKLWWRHKYMRSLASGIAIAMALFMSAIAVDLMGAVIFPDAMWKTLVLWLAHIATILSIFLVLDQTKLRSLAPAILLLIEGCTFLAGFAMMRTARFMYGMWGMYFQSKWYHGETGVSVCSSLLLEGALLGVSYLAGRAILGRTMQSK